MSNARVSSPSDAEGHLRVALRGLYENPNTALERMLADARSDSAAQVRLQLKRDPSYYGPAARQVSGTQMEQVTELLRRGGLAEDIEGWLKTISPPAPAPRTYTIAEADAHLRDEAVGLYEKPDDAVERMRAHARAEGPDRVRTQLGRDFTHYGNPSPRLAGEARQRVQNLLTHGLGDDIELWLRDGSAPPAPRPEAERGSARSGGAWARVSSPDAAGQPAVADVGLNANEVLALESVEAFALALERADQRIAAEARLHALGDRLEHLKEAEARKPSAMAALREEATRTYAPGSKAVEQIESAIEQHGAAETARRVRSGQLLGKDQAQIFAPQKRFGFIPVRDRQEEEQARERVAQRIETVGYARGDLGKWSTFQPEHGPAVHGARNVRAAVEREVAAIQAESGIGFGGGGRRQQPSAVHPSIEAEKAAETARQRLQALSPESQQRVLRQAVARGGDRVALAVSHLQTLNTLVHTMREGIEPRG